MARIPVKYSVGNKEDMTPEKLITIIEDVYRILAKGVNGCPQIYKRNNNGVPEDGNTSDTFASIGDININTKPGSIKVEMCTEHDTSDTVKWTQLS